MMIRSTLRLSILDCMGFVHSGCIVTIGKGQVRSWLAVLLVLFCKFVVCVLFINLFSFK